MNMPGVTTEISLSPTANLYCTVPQGVSRAGAIQPAFVTSGGSHVLHNRCFTECCGPSGCDDGCLECCFCIAHGGKPRTLTTEAHSLGTDKPVYFYLWPLHHDGTPKQFEFIDAPHWTFQLDTACRNSNDVVLWGPSKFNWDDAPGWREATRNFVRALHAKPGIALAMVKRPTMPCCGGEIRHFCSVKEEWVCLLGRLNCARLQGRRSFPMEPIPDAKTLVPVFPLLSDTPSVIHSKQQAK